MQNYLTMNNFELALVIILAVCWGISMFLNARSGLRKARQENMQPITDLQETTNTLQKQLQSLESRILEMEGRSDIYGDKMTLVLRSQLSILSHLVNGNSVDKLRQSLQEINEYLVNR